MRRFEASRMNERPIDYHAPMTCCITLISERSTRQVVPTGCLTERQILPLLDAKQKSLAAVRSSHVWSCPELTDT